MQRGPKARLCKETATIGHGAVGEFKQRRQRRYGFRIDLNRGVGEFQEVERAFEAPPEIEEAPPVAARHIFHFHSAEGGEIGNERIDAVSYTHLTLPTSD